MHVLTIKSFLEFKNILLKGGTAVAIFVPLLLLYHRKIFEKIYRIEPNFILMFLAIKSKSS